MRLKDRAATGDQKAKEGLVEMVYGGVFDIGEEQYRDLAENSFDWPVIVPARTVDRKAEINNFMDGYFNVGAAVGIEFRGRGPKHKTFDINNPINWAAFRIIHDMHLIRRGGDIMPLWTDQMAEYPAWRARVRKLPPLNRTTAPQWWTEGKLRMIHTYGEKLEEHEWFTEFVNRNRWKQANFPGKGGKAIPADIRNRIRESIQQAFLETLPVDPPQPVKPGK